MGSGASSSKPSSGTESQLGNGMDNEEYERDMQLQQALKQEEDVSDFSISEIAKCRLKYPNIEPSSKRKAEVFTKIDQNGQVAKNVKNISSLVNESSNGLVAALTEGLEDDLSKVRAIYLFLASIDLTQIREPTDESVTPNSPLNYILRIKQGKANHAHIFCALCKIAGVPCEIISGYNKSASYQIGKPVDQKKMAAQWNAVYVCREWRLIDCFWSSACVVGNDDEDEWNVLDVDGKIVTGKKLSGSGKMTHRINEFFYLPDPEQMLATHFPKLDEWQLVSKADRITLEDFAQVVYRRERFFELGMKIPREDLQKCLLVAEQGEIIIELDITDDSPSIDFKYMLFVAKSSEDLGKLEKFVMFQRGSGRISYNAKIPVKGMFKLDIFGKDSRKNKSLDLICSYLIDCQKGSSDTEPLPDNPAIGWGPDGGYLTAYDMDAVTHKQGEILTDTGIVDIKFKMKQPLELVSLMLSNSHSKELLSQHAYMEIKDGECIIHVRLPESGVYACELFANEEGIPGELQNVCNYIIKCNKQISNEALPYTPNGKIGVFSVGKELGFDKFDPLNPEITTENGKVKVKVKVPEGIQLSGSLHHSQMSLENSNKQITMNHDGDTVTFDLDLLMSGKQCFALYASVQGESQCHNVFNYMIDNKSASKGKATKSADLPEIEKIHVRNGKAELTLTHTEAENVLASLYKEGTYLGHATSNITVKQEGVVSKVTIRLPEDGTYNLHLYEKTASSTSVLLKKRYELVHEGGVPDIPAEPEPELEPEDGELVSEEENVLIVEEQVSNTATDQEKEHSELRQKLVMAIEFGSETELKKAIKDFKDAGDVPDPNGLLERAEKDLSVITARKVLNAAITSEDAKALENAIKQAHSTRHRGKLNGEIAEAQRLLEKIRRIEKLRHAVLKLDQRTIAEIKSFATPPKAIETVMRGVLLLLGSTKASLKTWGAIVALIGKTGKESLKRRVMEFKVQNLQPELAAEAKAILTKFSFGEVRDASSGSATFYLWGTGMIEVSGQERK